MIRIEFQMNIEANIDLYPKTTILSFFEVSCSQRSAEFSGPRKDPELKLRLLNLLTYISIYFEGNSQIRNIKAKTYARQNSKITLSVEWARCQYRPTQPKPKGKIQGECFAPQGTTTKTQQKR